MIVHDWRLSYSEGELGERAQAPSTVHGPMTVKDGGGVGGGMGGSAGGEGDSGGGELGGVKHTLQVKGQFVCDCFV